MISPPNPPGGAVPRPRVTFRSRPFAEWCATQGIEPHETSIEQVAEFLRAQVAQGVSVALLPQRLRAVNALRPPPPDEPALHTHPTIRALLKPDAAPQDTFSNAADAAVDSPYWRNFARWCEETGHTAFPATVDTVASYFENASAHYKRSSLLQALSRIDAVHRARGLPTFRRVPRVLSSIQRADAQPRSTLPQPLRPTDFKALKHHLPSETPEGKMARAVAALAFSPLRIAQLKQLRVGNVRTETNPPRLQVKVSGQSAPLVFAEHSGWLSPQATVREWLAVHPERGNPRAALFITRERKRGDRTRIESDLMTVVRKQLGSRIRIESFREGYNVFHASRGSTRAIAQRLNVNEATARRYQVLAFENGLEVPGTVAKACHAYVASGNARYPLTQVFGVLLSGGSTLESIADISSAVASREISASAVALPRGEELEAPLMQGGTRPPIEREEVLRAALAYLTARRSGVSIDAEKRWLARRVFGDLASADGKIVVCCGLANAEDVLYGVRSGRMVLVVPYLRDLGVSSPVGVLFFPQNLKPRSRG